MNDPTLIGKLNGKGCIMLLDYRIVLWEYSMWTESQRMMCSWDCTEINKYEILHLSQNPTYIYAHVNINDSINVT